MDRPECNEGKGLDRIPECRFNFAFLLSACVKSVRATSRAGGKYFPATIGEKGVPGNFIAREDEQQTQPPGVSARSPFFALVLPLLLLPPRPSLARSHLRASPPFLYAVFTGFVKTLHSCRARELRSPRRWQRGKFHPWLRRYRIFPCCSNKSRASFRRRWLLYQDFKDSAVGNAGTTVYTRSVPLNAMELLPAFIRVFDCVHGRYGGARDITAAPRWFMIPNMCVIATLIIAACAPEELCLIKDRIRVLKCSFWT